MSPQNRRKALVGFGLLSCVAMLALVPTLHNGAPEAPDPTTRPTLDDGSLAGADTDLRFLPKAVAAYGDAPEAVSHEAYLSDRIMIRPADGQDPNLIAADYGGALFRKPGKSGWVSISIPTGTHVGGAVETLRADPRVAQAGPVGIVRGASTPKDIQEVAWRSMDVQSGSASTSIVVAVIDSGVAYEDYTSDGTTYAKAATFDGVTIAHPYDFVNDDSHANDDHMHGTHIASVIASEKQDKNDIAGVAPGAAIMPIKVLDHENKGTETDLVDGIWHAIDNGAEVINLSLAFDETYVPSSALQEALREAHEAGIVLVGAAGNEAADYQAWPAASRYVIGVAAACPDKSMADYSNTSIGIMVSGVGGCMNTDADSDGYPDGVLGETIVAGDPSQTQYVLWAGTSQAAATVSGLVARHLSQKDGSADAVPYLLQTKYTAVSGGGRDEGGGVGLPKKAGGKDVGNAESQEEYLVAVLPYLHRSGAGTAKPAALVHVVTPSGADAPEGDLWLSMRGSTSTDKKCSLSGGVCHFIDSTAVDLVDGDGNDKALGWSLSVEAFQVGGVDQRIEPGMFVSDGLEVLVAAMQDNSDTAGLPLGIYWPDNETPRSGMTTSESYAFVDSGVGFASSPLGVLLTPGNFPSSALTTETVDLDGVGFSSSPLGTMNLTVIEFGGVGFSSSPLGGVGFSSSPLGLSSFSLAAMDGVGFASSPLGLDAFDMYTTDSAGIDLAGVGFSSSPLGGVGFASSPLNLATGSIYGASASGTEIEDLLDAGGWTIGGGGYAIGTGLIGSCMVDTTPAAVGTGLGDGWEVFE